MIGPYARTVTDDLRDRTPAGVEVDRLLLAAKLSVPQPRRGFGESRRAHRGGQSERLPCRRDHRSRGVRQVDPAVSMGAGRGSSCRLGVSQRLRRRPRGPAHLAGLRLRSRLAGQRRPGRRHGRSGRVRIGTLRAAPRRGAQHEPSPVRAHVGRPPRTPVTGLSRCPGGGDLGDTSRVSTRGSESLGATPRPAATSGW